MTEPSYLRGLERFLRNATVEVVIPREQGVPRTLVDIAVQRKKDAEREAKRMRDDFLAYDEVWCVFDVDAHPNIADAKQKAMAHQLELAISNPCFELWLLLHFRESPGAQERHEMQRLVGTFLESYRKRVPFEDLAHGLEDARKRARRLEEDAREMGESGRNPTTGVYRLVDSMSRTDPA